jgi:hypothetical protein
MPPNAAREPVRRVSICDHCFTGAKQFADTLRNMDHLSAVVRWLRVHHLGAPRWFLAFVALLVATVGTVLATHWGH